MDKAKSEFVSLASHQLRTPLTGIEWTISLFSKKEKLTEQGKKYLNDINFSVNRLSMLIKLLLNVSRIESGNVGVVPEPLDLVALMAKDIREHQALSEKQNVSFIFAQHPEKLIAVTDKNLLAYIMHNLIANAIQYTPAGGKVEILLEEKKDSALYTIRDTGIGIPEKEQTRIFEKFVRASNAVTMKPDGTGLGLYIVRESVKLLGGKIWFESEETKGSAFFVELPLILRSHAGEKGLLLEAK
jgi:signal transduction histidine kinase